MSESFPSPASVTAAGRRLADLGFDEVERLSAAELRAAGTSKWVTYPQAIGSFIAESDFGTAPAVIQAVQRRVDVAAFGYSTKTEKADVGRALSSWLADRFDWRIEPGWVGVLPEVLTSLELTIDHYSKPGSAVIIPTPAYMPFFTVVRDHERESVQLPLLPDAANGWTFDYERIEQAFADGAGLLLLTNPANPTGTVFTREQLEPLVDIVDRHGGRVWADEIHAPVIFDGRRHVPYASLSETAAAHTITATSASKGWNIAGLKTSQIIFTNPEDLRRWRHIGRWPGHTTGYLGVFATIAAYDEGREWLDGLVAHLDARRAQLTQLVAELLPRAGFIAPQATYLAWLDLREYAVAREHVLDLAGHFVREAGVAGTDGRHCGKDFAGHFRFNFATPGPILEELVTRLARALDG